jgi:hypothetical protein
MDCLQRHLSVVPEGSGVLGKLMLPVVVSTVILHSARALIKGRQVCS